MRYLNTIAALACLIAAPAILAAQVETTPASAPADTAQIAQKADAKKKAPSKAKAAKQPPPTPAKELFGAAKTPAAMAARAIGFYAKGCLAGAHGAPDRWAGLAGHAAVAQPQLGPSRADRPGREARDRSQGARRLAGTSGRRPFAASRRSRC